MDKSAERERTWWIMVQKADAERVQCGQRQNEKTWWVEMLGEDSDVGRGPVDTGEDRRHYGQRYRKREELVDQGTRCDIVDQGLNKRHVGR